MGIWLDPDGPTARWVMGKRRARTMVARNGGTGACRRGLGIDRAEGEHREPVVAEQQREPALSGTDAQLRLHSRYGHALPLDLLLLRRVTRCRSRQLPRLWGWEDVMPYFPRKSESAYKCQGCGQWYIRGNLSCCVAHTPGTCCHYGETPSLPPQRATEGSQHERTGRR